MNLVYILHVVFGFTIVIFVYKTPWNVSTIASYMYTDIPTDIDICKFQPVSNFTELHTLTLVTCSYALFDIHSLVPPPHTHTHHTHTQTHTHTHKDMNMPFSKMIRTHCTTLTLTSSPHHPVTPLQRIRGGRVRRGRRMSVPM